jgi:hypothetical protein
MLGQLERTHTTLKQCKTLLVQQWSKRKKNTEKAFNPLTPNDL